LLGPLTLALALTAICMGNAPSVTGPDRGRTHVKRHMVNDDRSIELRPVNSSSSESDKEETCPVMKQLRDRHFATTVLGKLAYYNFLRYYLNNTPVATVMPL